jgi:hypothetical protein
LIPIIGEAKKKKCREDNLVGDITIVGWFLYPGNMFELLFAPPI